MVDVFSESDYFTGPPLTPDLIAAAEASLGYPLPVSYLDLLAQRNGGSLLRGCCPTSFATSWARDHFRVDAILGIGGPWGIDSELLGSARMIAEWGYPTIGIVICQTPSGGHDTVMLDYSVTSAAEPRVVYIDEDRVPRTVADSFDQFVEMLTSCAEVDE